MASFAATQLLGPVAFFREENLTIVRGKEQTPLVPFYPAPRHPPARRVASSALVPVTATMPASLGSFPTTQLSSPGPQGQVLFRGSTTYPCASLTTLVASASAKDIPLPPTSSTDAPSVATQTTLRSPIPVVSHLQSPILRKIVTPYSATAFEHELATHGLTKDFPLLAHRIRHGFPLTTGSFDFPSTHTPPNHPSCIGYEDFLDDFLTEEVALGRMSGPFSRPEVDSIFTGTTFVTTPFILDIKTAAIGEPKKVRVCRNSSKKYADGLSVNSFINPDDFSTAWTTASDMAEIVSVPPIPLFPSWFLVSLLALSLASCLSPPPSHCCHCRTPLSAGIA